MSEIQRPFEVTVGEYQLSLTLGRCACVMFRNQQEVDYLAVNASAPGDEEESALRIFNNIKLVRWMAGFAFHEDGIGLTTAEGQTFHEQYGWWPAVIIKDEPSETELEWFLDVNAGNIDEEWQGLREHPYEQ